MTSVQDRILASVDRLFEKQIAFTEQLVRFPSLRNQEAAIQAFVESTLRQRGYAVERHRTDATKVGQHPAFSPTDVGYDDSWNVVGRKAATGGGRSLAFNSHVDVVPATSSRWSTPPFEPRREGDWLYGRGAGDMKAGLAASIFALDAIADAGLTLCGDVQIQSVVEEEMTGNGAATLFVNGCVADAIFSPEPSDENLVRANAGVLKFRITTRGRPAHPREPESGRSAIDLMITMIGRLRELEGKWRAEGKAKPLFKDLVNPVSLTFGTINGGDWAASIPSDCAVEGRLGFFPGEDPQMRLREFEAFFDHVCTTDPDFAGHDVASMEWIGHVQAGYELAEGTSAEACLRAAHARANADADLKAITMACYLDATIFAVYGNIPSLVYGPVSQNVHGLDERVSLSSIRRVTKTMALFAADWCGVTERG